PPPSGDETSGVSYGADSGLTSGVGASSEEFLQYEYAPCDYYCQVNLQVIEYHKEFIKILEQLIVIYSNQLHSSDFVVTDSKDSGSLLKLTTKNPALGAGLVKETGGEKKLPVFG
ncbi:MAG: hypothetical protein G01um1014107_370, partial [Parcubacteria group bacterium Gr01-1014_107]